MATAVLGIATGLAVLLPSGAADAQLLDPRSQPEAASGLGSHQLTSAKRQMVAAANARAAAAGREMLRAGGSAIDAAIATQLVLNIVEPQSSGIGGGAFILYWDKAQAALQVYDGRETAPASAQPGRFMKDGKPMPFGEAVRSGLSIGVPGIVRLLEDAHRAHGKLAWAKLFEPAIRLAEEGFEVSPRLNLLLHLEGADSFVRSTAVFLHGEWCAGCGRARAEEPAVRQDAARYRGGRIGGVLQRRDCAGDC